MKLVRKRPKSSGLALSYNVHPTSTNVVGNPDGLTLLSGRFIPDLMSTLTRH